LRTGACGAGGARRNDDEEADKRAVAGAGNSGESTGSVRADNNQPKSGSKDVQNITLNVIF
jgi:hypothetical protein